MVGNVKPKNMVSVLVITTQLVLEIVNKLNQNVQNSKILVCLITRLTIQIVTVYQNVGKGQHPLNLAGLVVGKMMLLVIVQKGKLISKKCNIKPPKLSSSTVPECPMAAETYESGDIAHNANNIFALKCWSKATCGWTCRGNTDTKCDASEGELNFKSCNIPPPPPTTLERPTEKDRCRRSYPNFPQLILKPQLTGLNLVTFVIVPTKMVLLALLIKLTC